jgi:hypothetical protein
MGSWARCSYLWAFIRRLLLQCSSYTTDCTVNALRLPYDYRPIGPVQEITRYSCENHMYHMNTFCIENAKVFNMKAGGTYSYHCVLKGYRLSAYIHVVPVYKHYKPRLDEGLWSVSRPNLFASRKRAPLYELDMRLGEPITGLCIGASGLNRTTD